MNLNVTPVGVSETTGISSALLGVTTQKTSDLNVSTMLYLLLSCNSTDKLNSAVLISCLHHKTLPPIGAGNAVNSRRRLILTSELFAVMSGRITSGGQRNTDTHSGLTVVINCQWTQFLKLLDFQQQ